MCAMMMEAHVAEDFSQVEFTVLLIYLMHRSCIGWRRAAMEAFISKSTYLEPNFGKDLLWVCQGTSAMRPMLHARAFRNGKCECADFLDHQYFRVARRHGEVAASASTASAQGAMMKSLGAPKMRNAECKLAEELSNDKFRVMNPQLTLSGQACQILDRS